MGQPWTKEATTVELMTAGVFYWAFWSLLPERLHVNQHGSTRTNSFFSFPRLEGMPLSSLSTRYGERAASMPLSLALSLHFTSLHRG